MRYAGVDHIIWYGFGGALVKEQHTAAANSELYFAHSVPDHGGQCEYSPCATRQQLPREFCTADKLPLSRNSRKLYLVHASSHALPYASSICGMASRLGSPALGGLGSIRTGGRTGRLARLLTRLSAPQMCQQVCGRLEAPSRPYAGCVARASGENVRTIVNATSRSKLACPWIWPPIECGSGQSVGRFEPITSKWRARERRSAVDHKHRTAQAQAVTVQGCAICGTQYAQIYDGPAFGGSRSTSWNASFTSLHPKPRYREAAQRMDCAAE